MASGSTSVEGPRWLLIVGCSRLTIRPWGCPWEVCPDCVHTLGKPDREQGRGRKKASLNLCVENNPTRKLLERSADHGRSHRGTEAHDASLLIRHDRPQVPEVPTDDTALLGPDPRTLLLVLQPKIPGAPVPRGKYWYGCGAVGR